MSNYKYINKIPKPLLNDFVENKVVPFVGAGFSKNADIPQGLIMPDWNELGKLVADEIPDYDFDGNVIDTLSLYESNYSRPKLIELMLEKLHIGEIGFGSTYRAFCEVFTDIICTTNFDFLLEDTLRDIKRPFSIIATEDRLAVFPKEETKLIKLHGDFNHPDRMVITEQDYDTYISKNQVMATFISNLFITKTMFLVGYSLDDSDFRNLWQVINSRLGNMTRPAYCLTVGAKPDKIARYARRNIKVINLPGDTKNYKHILYMFFSELKEYMYNEKVKQIKSTDDKINEQVYIPDKSNRLCFISCSTKRISQLKNILYPPLIETAITPTRLEDVFIPGNNWMDASRTIIKKSNIIIIDISDNNPNVMYELGITFNEKPNNIIIICEEGTTIPLYLVDHLILKYSFDDFNKQDIISSFQTQLKEQCKKILDNNDISTQLFNDAIRLFEKKEYSACIISAFSELELKIKEKYDCLTSRNSLPIIMKDLVSKGIYDKNSYNELNNYWSIRNSIVHKGYIATRKDAKLSLEFIKLLF